ncbi:hypothetical protein KIH23_08410 [Flavobacterium sp. CYK-55]|uniref:hypothetical protein n=1 Tax=Flavobacterium sp. CYK-55 TaxID=2835529 RepID=UPI001BCDE8DA|nr:hypothetical protein [Flavobacterium sp. CYK-55]MBS7787319.1 hypothetical protein [Flavobacterium sp. CYK-55]
MFVESAFITKEFREEQIPVLENVTSLCVVNKGTSIAQVNGVLIYPTQKQILVVPDGTYSKVQLEVIYTDTNNSKKGYTPKNKILLIYKKLI